jgi:peptidyl-prolyl cis-trans isomerase D
MDQALFEKEEDAKAVAEAVKSGKDLQSAIRATTKRDSDYLGQKTFETDNIPAELKTVFAEAKNGEVAGPIKTSIGWQLGVVKKITPAQTKSYDSVKKEIRDELLENKVIDQQYALSGQVEDMLAGGSTLDDVKKEVDITVTNLPEMNSFGQAKGGGDALKDYEKTKNFILENGFELGEGETSQMSEGTTGDFMAVHVVKITPKVYTPFEQVKDSMMKRWMSDQHRAENRLQVMQDVEEIKKSKETPDQFAKGKNKVLQSRSNLNRMQKPSEPLDERSWANIFEATPNEPFVLDLANGFAVAWVTKTVLPDSVNADSKEFKDFKTGLLKGTQNEAIAMYGESKNQKYGARINRKLLDQVYGQNNESN